MQLGIDSQIPDGLLAANALLAENSRQGVPTSTHTLHRGFEFAISSTYIGLQFRCYESASDPVDAPNNGTPRPTILSCTATKDVALALGATALDGFGAIPVANEVTGSIQLGAGIVSAGITVYAGNVKNAGFAGTGLGLAAADKSLGEAAFGGAKLIPGLGNLVSGLSAVYDVFGEGGVIDSYKKCLAGH